MIHAPRSVEQASCNIFRFEVRVRLENLRRQFSGREQFQDVDHADSHTANTRAPATLLKTDGDALEEVG